MNGVRMRMDYVNGFEMVHDDYNAFTCMDTKLGSPTFYTWGL